ncbi:MAG: LPS assembly protein LptD [Pseudomonadales bacterium]
MNTRSSISSPAVLTACMLFSLMLSGPASAAENAASIDWVPFDDLSATQLNSLPWYCTGGYVQPDDFAEPAPHGDSGPIEATAASGEHVRNGVTRLSGDVEVRQGQRLVKSPRVTLDDNQEIANIEGPMRLREPGLLMTGSHAEINLATGTGLIDDASFLIHSAHLRGEAKTLDRQPNTDLVITGGKFTRCEPTSNMWSITGSDIRLEPRTGVGTARNVTVRVKDVPVAWVPWIRFPMDDKRQSGFLFPSLSQDSRGGTDITVPYYFNLAPNYDATYKLRSMWKRGFIHDGQFRWLTERTENAVNAAFLREDDKFDERERFDETTSGTGTTAEFEKEDRWLLHVSHDGIWSPRWRTSISYSAVSDIDYLHDIGGDVGSSSVRRFTDPADRSLSSRRSAALDRKGQIQYRGDAWTWLLLAHGYQNLDRDGQEQYERLPKLAGNYADTWSIFDLDLDLEYTYFDKDNEDISGRRAIIGGRALVDAAASIPLRTVWGFAEPSLSVVHRSYNLDDTPENARTNPHVTTPVFSFDAGLYFDRLFTIQQTGFQQTLEPRIFYLYVEEKDQDDLPEFEATPLTPGFAQLFREKRFSGVDRIGDANQLSVGITTRLLHQDTGAELVSASMGQIYHFKDREVIFRPEPGFDPEADSSPIFAQATLNLHNGLRITGSYEWEPRLNRSNRGKLSLKYNPDERHIFNFSYINANEEVENLGQFRNEEETDLSFIWPVSGQWSVVGRWNFNWDDHQTIESLFGFEYNDCCWKSRLVFRRFLQEPRNFTVLVDDPGSPSGFREINRRERRADTGIFFEFQLKGLATLGRRLDSLLEEAIAGYREREQDIGF